MFGSLGFPEILFILALALIVFGPRRLPEVGRTIGRALGEFRRATGDLKRTFDRETSSFEQDAGLDSVTAVRPEARTPVPEPASGSNDIAGSESDPASDLEFGSEAEIQSVPDYETESEPEGESKDAPEDREES